MDAKCARNSVLRGMTVILAAVFALALSVAFAVPQARADQSLQGTTVGVQYTDGDEIVTPDGIHWKLWFGGDPAPGSILVVGYTGTATELKIPTSIVVDGKTVSLTTAGSHFSIGGDYGATKGVFEDNKTLTKIAIPNNVVSISANAFLGCDNLTDIWIDGSNLYSASTTNYIDNAKIGRANDATADSPASILPNVTVHTTATSPLIAQVAAVNAAVGGTNQIKVDSTCTNPYDDSGIGGGSGGGDTPSGGGDTPGGGTDGKTMGEDGTPYGPGASESVVDEALTGLSIEDDQPGMVFRLLRTKASKLTNKSVKLTWAKPAGTAKFVVYGAKCGKNNKLVKLKETTSKNATFSKVAGAKVKKGTYYKFVVVALDANNKVVTTSRMVHAATSGGKVGNHKSVTVAKKKVTVKTKKTFKLKGKAKVQKLTVKNHRKVGKVAYESSNESIATVDKKGKIKGLKKGKCEVYAYAQNGVFAKVKVTVK